MSLRPPNPSKGVGADAPEQTPPAAASCDPMQDTSLLRGLVLALNRHLTAARRHCDSADAEALRHELAICAAMVDIAREAIGPDEIAAKAQDARDLLARRDVLEVGVAEGYRLWSESYDDELNPVIELETPALEAMIGDVAGKRSLDVGCGTGRWARRLAAQGAVVTAIDPSAEMLAKARQAADKDGLIIEWVEGGFGQLPAQQPFDLVMCNLVLCHIADIAAPIREMALCLRPGGRLIISDFHYLCQIIGWRTAFSVGEQRYHVENYQHDYGDFVRAFHGAGLTIAAIEDILLCSVPGNPGMERVAYYWEGFPVSMVVMGAKPA